MNYSLFSIHEEKRHGFIDHLDKSKDRDTTTKVLLKMTTVVKHADCDL